MLIYLKYYNEKQLQMCFDAISVKNTERVNNINNIREKLTMGRLALKYLLAQHFYCVKSSPIKVYLARKVLYFNELWREGTMSPYYLFPLYVCTLPVSR
jgi:hypothetical protein